MPLAVALVAQASTLTLLERPLVRLVPVVRAHHRAPRLHRNVPRATLMAFNLVTNPQMEPAVSCTCSGVVPWADIDLSCDCQYDRCIRPFSSCSPRRVLRIPVREMSNPWFGGIARVRRCPVQCRKLRWVRGSWWNGLHFHQ